MSEKKYLIDNPALMEEWNWGKNNELKFNPQTLTVGSNKKVWWKCSKEHEWQATIRDRNYGTRCPYCFKKLIVKGENDLQTLNPRLAKEWNYEKNKGLTPCDVFLNSGKKVWWKCNKGHEWQSVIRSRNKGVGCPYCSNKRVLQGYNDLITLAPRLLQEWNYSLNQDLKPENVTAKSGKKAWWICKKGHIWQAVILSRIRGRGCPVCTSGQRTSFPEYAFVYYLKKHGVDVIHSYREQGYELDVYIPSKKTAIEYDGYYWHKNREKKDLAKNSKCKKDGIKLYRIREDLPKLNDSSIDYVVQSNQKDLSNIIQQVLCKIAKIKVDVDLERDAIAIENLREYTEKENSLLFCNPELAKEWNYERNGNLKPETVSAKSNKWVWWKCQKGHEWKSVIASRNSGHGCPYCSNRKALQGYNDLATYNPSLAREWNYGLNKNSKPEQFTVNSGRKVWWKCSKGHEYQATIHNRNKGSGCPYCSNQKTLQGYNDLRTFNPCLAKEWDYKLNAGLKIEKFTPNSHKKAWWKCQKGHEWQATIKDRNQGNGCPYCSNRKVLQGYNDLATYNPSLAKEWDYSLNKKLTPECVSANSHKKAWWKCQKGHEWQATIKDRNQGNDCPYCSNHKVLQGYNDLATLNSNLAKEWNYDMNGGLTPFDVTHKSHKKVWWKCSKGHEWQAKISNRANGCGCPYCFKRKK